MSRRKQSILVKILLSLFLLNTLSLLFYFSTHHHSNGKPPSMTENHHQRPHRSTYLKPWPILPSYLPWTQLSSSVPPRSCEAYFGNGFTRRVDVLPPGDSGGSGWFRCFYGETLRSSVCEGGSVRMVVEKVRMESGGERLEHVIGRGEDVELPHFEPGAFQLLGLESGVNSLVDDEFLDSFMPLGVVSRHTMRALLGSLRIVDQSQFQCDQDEKSRAFVGTPSFKEMRLEGLVLPSVVEELVVDQLCDHVGKVLSFHV